MIARPLSIRAASPISYLGPHKQGTGVTVPLSLPAPAVMLDRTDPATWKR